MGGNVKPGNPWPSEGLGRALDIAGNDKPYEVSPVIGAVALLLDTTGPEYHFARRSAWLAAGALTTVPAGGQFAQVALRPRTASAAQGRIAICRRVWLAALDGADDTTPAVAQLEYQQEITLSFTGTARPGPLDLRQLAPPPFTLGLAAAPIQATWQTNWSAIRVSGPGNADGAPVYPVRGLADGGSTLDTCIVMQSSTYQGIAFSLRSEYPDIGLAYRFEWEELDVSVQNLQSRS